MRRIRRHLTFANVVALIALSIALGGGAYASGLIGPRDIRNNAIHSRHIKNGQVTGADVKESSLGTVPSANPAAFARVNSSGGVSGGLSKGVTNANVTIATLDDSIYCFHGLKFRPRGGQVTIDFDPSTPETLTDFGLSPSPECPAGTQAFVWIHDRIGGDVPAPFFVAFYR